jgi:predicted Zn-ribbon and HTH transcriptional regulator
MNVVSETVGPICVEISPFSEILTLFGYRLVLNGKRCRECCRTFDEADYKMKPHISENPLLICA